MQFDDTHNTFDPDRIEESYEDHLRDVMIRYSVADNKNASDLIDVVHNHDENDQIFELLTLASDLIVHQDMTLDQVLEELTPRQVYDLGSLWPVFVYMVNFKTQMHDPAFSN